MLFKKILTSVHVFRQWGKKTENPKEAHTNKTHGEHAKLYTDSKPSSNRAILMECPEFLLRLNMTFSVRDLNVMCLHPST